MRLLLLRGRAEHRVPIGTPLYLARPSPPHETELVLAVDAAEHGLRVATSRYWRPGEVLQIRPLSNEFVIKAKVAYCRKRFRTTFYTGLSLENPIPRWREKFRIGGRAAKRDEVLDRSPRQ
jgi:hypothetical protein